jgi:hypothetical protein
VIEAALKAVSTWERIGVGTYFFLNELKLEIKATRCCHRLLSEWIITDYVSNTLVSAKGRWTSKVTSHAWKALGTERYWFQILLLPLMEIIGLCPICDREMWKDKFVDKHHFLPNVEVVKKQNGFIRFVTERYTRFLLRKS